MAHGTPARRGHPRNQEMKFAEYGILVRQMLIDSMARYINEFKHREEGFLKSHNCHRHDALWAYKLDYCSFCTY